MGKYVTITGSLICSEKQVEIAESYISSLNAKDLGIEIDEARFDLYMKGWVFPRIRMNWASYIFYGGCVREQYAEMIKKILNGLIAEFHERLSLEESDVDGYFWLDFEEGNTVFWKINTEVIEVTCKQG